MQTLASSFEDERGKEKKMMEFVERWSSYCGEVGRLEMGYVKVRQGHHYI
jgi:hypothetical protein